MAVANLIRFSGIRATRDEQDVLLLMLRHATSDRQFCATSSRIRAWTVDTDQDKRREFVKRRRE